MADQAQCTGTRHGTVNAYRRHSCRCPDTIDLTRAYWRNRTRRRAQTRTPYVDPIAVERACAGDRVRLTRAERRTAVATLHGRGLTARTISTRLGITPRSVQRHRLALRQPTQAA